MDPDSPDATTQRKASASEVLTTNSPFLELPGELRNTIYRHLLQSVTGQIYVGAVERYNPWERKLQFYSDVPYVFHGDSDSDNGDDYSEDATIHVEILATCRQVRDEALRIMLQENRYRFNGENEMKMFGARVAWPGLLLRSVELHLTTPDLVWIHDAEGVLLLNRIREFVDRFPGIQELLVDAAIPKGRVGLSQAMSKALLRRIYLLRDLPLRDGRVKLKLDRLRYCKPHSQSMLKLKQKIAELELDANTILMRGSAALKTKAANEVMEHMEATDGLKCRNDQRRGPELRKAKRRRRR